MLKHNIHACTRSRNEKGGGESEPFFFSFYINIHTAAFITFFEILLVSDRYVPSRYVGSAATPLFVVAHGFTSSPSISAQHTKMETAAEAQGVLSVFPEGLKVGLSVSQRVAYRVLMLIHSFPCHAASLVTETHATSVAAHAATHVVLIISY